MGSWFSDMVSNINWNPMASPITQAVVGGTVQAVSGVVTAVTAPVVAVASAVGIDVNPMHSPLFSQVIKPAADIVGSTLIGVPLGTAAATVGGIMGGSQDRMTGSGVYRPYSPPAPVVVQVPAPRAQVQLPADAAAQASAALAAGVPAQAVAAGYRSGTWPRYRR
jgi:hypothetical protein